MPTVRLLSGPSFAATTGETLLDAARRAGIPMRAGCRVGACRTCCAQLVEGAIRMPPGTALTAADLDEELILPCVAVATTDVVLDDRQRWRTPLPWTD